MFSAEFFDEHCLYCKVGNSTYSEWFPHRKIAFTMLLTAFKDNFEIGNGSELGLVLCFQSHLSLLTIRSNLSSSLKFLAKFYYLAPSS